MGQITLVTGGARSGKSAFAHNRALNSCYRDRLFIATAQNTDEEMAQRIARHRQDRGDRFTTIEEPVALGNTLDKACDLADVILVDCLTVWLGNCFYCRDSGEEIERDVDQLLEILRRWGAARADLLLVTNEVGWGIVPDNLLARRFRDCAGTVNRAAAALAQSVFLVISGIPMCIKGDVHV